MVVARLRFEYIFFQICVDIHRRICKPLYRGILGHLSPAFDQKQGYFNRIIGQNECNARLLTLLHPTNSIVENEIEVSQEFCGVILIEQLPHTHRVKLMKTNAVDQLLTGSAGSNYLHEKIALPPLVIISCMYTESIHRGGTRESIT
jgi:hypothetical protein